MPPSSSIENTSRALISCRNLRNRVHISHLYDYMLSNGLEFHGSLGNELVWMSYDVKQMYKNQQILNRSLSRNEISSNTLKPSYFKGTNTQHGCHTYWKMQRDSPATPNNFVTSLKACGKVKDLHQGIKIHQEVSLAGLLGKDRFVMSSLIGMYVKCGSIEKAQEAFDSLACQDITSWNVLITGYTEFGQSEDALGLYDRMKWEDVVPNSITFLGLLKACKNIGNIEKGQELHAEISRRGLMERKLSLGSAMLDMYAKCGQMAKAQEVFNKLSIRNKIVWTAVIAGYVEHGYSEKALGCYEQMQHEHVHPDSHTYVLCLKACGAIRATEKGREIHEEIERRKLLEGNMFLYSALVDMYARCGFPVKAQEVFDRIQAKNTVLWNTLISSYVQDGDNEQALQCYEQMQHEGITPDAITLLCTLQACGRIGAMEKGIEIHDEVSKNKLFEMDHLVGCGLIDMYAKFGLLEQAQELLDLLPGRNVVAWNALIDGYVEHGHGTKAIGCFEKMQLEGLSVGLATYSSMLKACGSIGATAKGQKLHAEIERKGLIEKDVIGNCLVDMYVKWGWLSEAQKLFDKISARDIISWNTLMTGYAQHGEEGTIFLVFDSMLREGLKPDPITFLLVLNACSRTCLYDKSRTYLDTMSEVYGVIPTQEHHSCMIDLLGRLGQLEKAMVRTEKLSLPPNPSTCHALLGACRNWGNMNIGLKAFHHALRSDRSCAVSCFSFSRDIGQGKRKMHV